MLILKKIHQHKITKEMQTGRQTEVTNTNTNTTIIR